MPTGPQPVTVLPPPAAPARSPAHRLEESARLLERARRVDASFLLRPGVIGSADDDVPSPVFAERAEGAYLWDVDGNRYLDFVLSFGAVVLGHADPAVTAAVTAELGRGVSPTLHRALQVELIELLLTVIPGAEMALLLKAGSDATAAAVRVARAYTGRRRVLHWGYHGWHEWCAPRPGGLSPGVQDHLRTFPYNDLAALDGALSDAPGDVACVIMMPLETETPTDGYLTGVRALAHRHGALFVLDEVRSGFRLALGGAQEYFGVQADLVALSKAMANGHPVSALAGRRDVLEAVRRISVSSLFFRSGDGIAAALATVHTIKDRNVVDVLWERGRQLVAGLRRAAARQRVPVEVIGLPPMPQQRFGYRSAAEQERAEQVFYAETRARGVLFHPSHQWFTCAAMSGDDIRSAVEAAEAGYAAVRRAVGECAGQASAEVTVDDDER
jgi:glutamate-1-semialdehyde aminotransferase